MIVDRIRIDDIIQNISECGRVVNPLGLGPSHHKFESCHSDQRIYSRSWIGSNLSNFSFYKLVIKNMKSIKITNNECNIIHPNIATLI